MNTLIPLTHKWQSSSNSIFSLSKLLPVGQKRKKKNFSLDISNFQPSSVFNAHISKSLAEVVSSLTSLKAHHRPSREEEIHFGLLIDKSSGSNL